jgi:O-antigen ligase
MDQVHGRQRRRPRDPALFGATAALIVIALLLGGAGVHYPLITALIEAAGFAVLAFAMLRGGAGLLRSPSRAANILIIATIALIVLQLVPIPYQLWAGLPGRALPADLLALAGADGGARPMSLNPHATLGSGLALIPAIAIFLIASRLPVEDQQRLLTICVATALCGALLGALQKAMGAGALVPWITGHEGSGPGLFVNRNHQAAFLLAAIPSAAVLATRANWPLPPALARLVGAGAILLLAGGAIATTSRMGILLLPLAVLMSVMLLVPAIFTLRRAALTLIALAVVALAVLQSSGAGVILRRFTGSDIRFDYWIDTRLAIEQFWPWGSGLGTFADIFPSVENLNVINDTRAYNAHNDYMELLLEGGLPAIALIAGFLLLLAIHAWRIRRAPRSQAALKLAAAMGMVLILLHSVVDYPLRMFSISALFALFLAMLVAPAAIDRRERERSA